MNYETVILKEKKIVGVRTRIKNSDPEMIMKIGSLWNDFHNKGIYTKIENKVNNKALGIYSDYEGDCNSEYSVTVGCEVKEAKDIPESTVVKIIPEGKYAKFIIRGHIQRAVAEFWENLWKMDLNRNYICDFEEYQYSEDINNTEIHVYVSIN